MIHRQNISAVAFTHITILDEILPRKFRELSGFCLSKLLIEFRYKFPYQCAFRNIFAGKNAHSGDCTWSDLCLDRNHIYAARASRPETISETSRVMAAWRILL